MSYIQQLKGSGLDYIADYEKAVRALGNNDVRRMARKILDDANRVKVVMRPATAE